MGQYHASKQKDCNLQIVTTSSGKSTWNVAFQHSSAWNSVISKKILEYKEQGLISDVYKKWMHSSCTSKSGVTVTNYEFTIKHFGGFIVILSVSFITSFVILLLEHIFFKKKDHTNRYKLKA